MYFNQISDLQYPVRPIGFPFSESDYVVAKNFFRRFQINPDIFDYAVYFKKVAVESNTRIEQLAQDYYGDVNYDWVVVLTNNMIDPRFALPYDNETLQKFVESKYGDDAYSGIHHYETIAFTIGGRTLEAGVRVDQNYYQTNHVFNSSGSMVTVAGNLLATPVTNYEYEVQKNEERREVFVLRGPYVEAFIESFREQNTYKESTNFISSRLKKAG